MKLAGTITFQIVTVLIAVLVGFWIGAKKTAYAHARVDIAIHLSSNAKLDANRLDAIKNDNDVIIRSAYTYLQTIPLWIRMFSSEKEKNSDRQIERTASALKASLDKTDSSPVEIVDVEKFVRNYMGTHSTFRVDNTYPDRSDKDLKKKPSHD